MVALSPSMKQQQITGLVISQALPKHYLSFIKQYGIEFSSHYFTMVINISSGSQSALNITHYTIPLLIALIDSFIPFLTIFTLILKLANSKTFEFKS